eukprot:scaffold14144_cov91-Skeletonema_dohrnii-CCMP3373.AAC.6
MVDDDVFVAAAERGHACNYHQKEHSSFKEQVKNAYLRYVATSSKDASSVTDEQWEELDSMVSEPIIDTSPETFLAADAASASPVSGWRSDLDWAALTSKLSFWDVLASSISWLGDELASS